MVTLVKLLQPENALAPIEVTLLGMLILIICDPSHKKKSGISLKPVKGLYPSSYNARNNLLLSSASHKKQNAL